MLATEGVNRQVVRWYQHDEFERLPHRTIYRATLSCGHVITLDEDEIVGVDLPKRDGLAVLPCPECLLAEREQIVADLPGAD
jgi:hypothetical protein